MNDLEVMYAECGRMWISMRMKRMKMEVEAMYIGCLKEMGGESRAV